MFKYKDKKIITSFCTKILLILTNGSYPTNLPKLTTSNTLEDLSSDTVLASSPLLLTLKSSIVPVGIGI